MSLSMDFNGRWLQHPQRWATAVALGGAVILSGCVVAPVDDGYADYGYSSTTVYTTYGRPPPPRVEYRTVAPSPHHVWVGGDWLWGGSRYDWRPGRWAAPGYRPAPPPVHRPMVQPPRPVQVQPVPQPIYRPGQRPPSSPQIHNDAGHRPPALTRPTSRPEGVQRPSPARPDRAASEPQARPDSARREAPRTAPPPRRDGEERRASPPRRDGDEERAHRQRERP